MPLLFIKKSSIRIKCKVMLLNLLTLTFFAISTVNANDYLSMIELSSLGDFEADFSEVKTVTYMKSQSLIGEVSYISGENYSVIFPFDVQRISYQVNNGSNVNKGDTIALVQGYDVHHFIDEYYSTKALLKIQEAHFQTNKQYFENKTIKSSQWVDITKSYYEAKLNFEHIQHQMSFLHIDEDEKISFISPETGVIQIPNINGSKKSGQLAFNIIDDKSIKVKVVVPLLLASNLSHFEVDSTCKLEITSVEQVADKYHQILWAKSTSTHCSMTLGQVIKVTPIKRIQAYKIDKAAVFEFENNNFIAINSNKKLSLVLIKLIGATSDNYIFTTEGNIEEKQALISSVSILQGYLLRMGVE